MRGNQKNKNYQMVWSPDFAYAIGLLAADGNLSNDGRHIDLTSKDIQLLNTFKKCVKLNGVKISTKSDGYSETKYLRIQFSNVRLYRWLLGIGLMPNKSKTISELKIPNKYFFDFLRGCFDGDGYFYSYWDKRWKNSFMFYTVFTSASQTHIQWLRYKIEKFLGIKGHLNRDKGNSLWRLKYAKNESRKLLSKLYYSESLSCSQRKYLKIKCAEVVERDTR